MTDTVPREIDPAGPPSLSRRELREARERAQQQHADEQDRVVATVATVAPVAPVMTVANDTSSHSSPVYAAAEPVSPTPHARVGTDASARTAPRERSLLSYIANAIIITVLTALLGVAAAAIVVPAATGSTPLTVMTSSMEPALPPGTMVVVRPTDPADIRVGMVLTYQLRSGDPTVVTHRVVERMQQENGEYVYITQGDNNPSPDVDPVREVQVRGTVWYAIPYLGHASAALSGDWRAFVVPILVLGLFGYAAVMVIGAARDRARRRASSAGDAARD